MGLTRRESTRATESSTTRYGTENPPSISPSFAWHPRRDPRTTGPPISRSGSMATRHGPWSKVPEADPPARRAADPLCDRVRSALLPGAARRGMDWGTWPVAQGSLAGGGPL